MFHLEALAERLPLTSIFQNMTFIHYVQRLANVTKIAKLNLPSIYQPRYEKNNNVVFRPGLTQTRLYSHRRYLEAGKFGYRK